ncbi:MAG: hypothetical protein GY853_09925 [PVC group bacterium]|nr:hypothetical protein [PVC group bacterium]
MEKIYKTEETNVFYEVDDNIDTIDALITVLQKLKLEGFTSVELDVEDDYGSISANLLASKRRLETDEEYEKRLVSEEKN